MNTSPAERQNVQAAGTQASAEALRRDVYLGLQICRANSLSLTRLQFALKHGDRKSVLEAVDRLHELDSQTGRLLRSLPPFTNDDPELQAICRHVEQQSMAVAFEKLALVSEVSGPDMVTAGQSWGDSGAVMPSGDGDRGFPGHGGGAGLLHHRKAIVFVVTLAVFMALVGAALWALGG